MNDCEQFWERFRPGSIALLCLGIVLWSVSCEKSDLHKNSKTKPSEAITVIEGEAHFNGILERSKNRLLLFEFYADWCAPCKNLETILEDLAEKYKDELNIYKIDYDDNRELSNLFKVQGLPFVAFVKDKVIIHTMLGLYPKKAYQEAIERYLSQ
jgi:thioredoxin-like negative regulator of GroEL